MLTKQNLRAIPDNQNNKFDDDEFSIYDHYDPSLGANQKSKVLGQASVKPS